MRRASPEVLAATLWLCPLFLAGCEGGGATAAAEATGASPRVERGELRSHLLLTGELVAEDAVSLIAPNVNLWPLQIRWLAEDGSRVEQGARVVELDNSSLVNNLEEIRLRAVEAANQLAAERARVAGELGESLFEVERRRAELAKARLEAEVPAELRSPREYQEDQLAHERARLELETAEKRLEANRRAASSQVAVAELALERALGEVRRAEEGIALLALEAPRAGLVLIAESRDEGRLYQAGDNVFPGQTLAELPDLETLVVSARLFDVDDGLVAAGMPVRLSVDAYPERSFEGRVREVKSAAEQLGVASLRRSFEVTVELGEVDLERLRPGMSVKVEVEVLRLEDALLAPRASLRLDDGENGAAGLRLADGSWRQVRLGACNAQVCALEEGPEEGTELGRALESAG